jgi:hypothetical protein
MSDNKNNKTFADGVFVKAKDAGGTTVLKVSIKAEDFAKFLEQHTNEGGWVNLDIWPRRTPSDKGHTHTVSLDDWKPNKDASAPAAKTAPAQKAAPKKTAVAKAAPAEVDGEEPPF